MIAEPTLLQKKKLAEKVIKLLKNNYPDSGCTLKFKTVHQLLVATILSAQCTDERVNKVTPGLFKKYRSIKAFAEAGQGEMEQAIFSTGFFKNKARAIRNSARILVETFGSKMPKTLAELITLPGVGRKTGSVILGAGFNLAEGIVVDTHVGRLSRRFGLSNHNDAKRVERDLIELIPTQDWIIFSHLLIDHGRAFCQARRPDCKHCFLNRLCPSAEVG